MDDGLPAGLDRDLDPWAAQWPGVLPTTPKLVHRRQRLEALGNSIVPQIAYLVARLIMEFHDDPT